MIILSQMWGVSLGLKTSQGLELQRSVVWGLEDLSMKYQDSQVYA